MLLPLSHIFRRDKPPVPVQQLLQPCLKQDLPTAFPDLLAHRGDDAADTVGTQMRLGEVSDLPGRAMVDEDLHHLRRKRILVARRQLAVRKCPGPALAKTGVAFRVKHPLGLQTGKIRRARLNRLAALQQQRTIPPLGQPVGGKQAARPRPHHQDAAVKRLFALVRLRDDGCFIGSRAPLLHPMRRRVRLYPERIFIRQAILLSGVERLSHDPPILHLLRCDAELPRRRPGERRLRRPYRKPYLVYQPFFHVITYKKATFDASKAAFSLPFHLFDHDCHARVFNLDV